MKLSVKKPDSSELQGGLWVPSSVSRRQVLLGAMGIGAAATLAACGGGDTSTDNAKGSSGKPKRGGNFRLGITGGGTTDTFDAQNNLLLTDIARLFSAFETLMVFDDNFRVTNDGLAESVTADTPTQYTIRLRKGIEFHNGKTVTADDVIYSLRRIATDEGLPGHGAAATIDAANMKKLDDLTVRVPLKVADSTLPQKLAIYYFTIVPVGYKTFKGDPSTQIGTGAYKLKSFTPGQQSVSVRNPNYWRGDGSPWFDQVTIIDFKDTTAQINALNSNQIDAMNDIPASQIPTVQRQGNKILNVPSGWWLPMCMAVDMPPFDDNRVREAFRLIVDRKAMLEQVVSGFGTIGNDMYAPYDAAYNKELPQRERDIDKAKSLLKAAGHDGLTVDLYTTNSVDGLVQTANVFASQAKDAGVTVNVKNRPPGDFYGDNYLKYAFSMDAWPARTYLPQVGASALPSAPYNETHWPPKSGPGSNFEDLYNQALATTDSAKATEIQKEMQKLEYENGGYIIPFFPAKVDAHSPKVQGFDKAKTAFGLNDFGRGFRSLWFD